MATSGSPDTAEKTFHQRRVMFFFEQGKLHLKRDSPLSHRLWMAGLGKDYTQYIRGYYLNGVLALYHGEHFEGGSRIHKNLPQVLLILKTALDLSPSTRVWVGVQPILTLGSTWPPLEEFILGDLLKGYAHVQVSPAQEAVGTSG